MREIKFRVYWTHQESDSSGFNYFEAGETFEDKDINQIFYNIEQYTGLKDKNGKEIYEGDILNEPASPVGGKDGGYLYLARVIEWLGAGRGYNLFAPYAASEVIGNIHENPELLKD